MRIHRSFGAAFVTLAAACHHARPSGEVAVSENCPSGASPQSIAVERSPSNPAATFDSAWSIIARSHWDTTYNGVNWRMVRDTLRPKAAAATSNASLRQVLSAMLSTLGQSHFSIIPGNSAPGAATERDLTGSLGITVRDASPELLVTAVRPGSSAALAGIRPGYALLAIDGCPLPARTSFARPAGDDRQLKLDRWRDASGRLRGPVGTTVRLAVRNEKGRLVTLMAAREAEPGELTKIGNLPAMPVQLSHEKRVSAARTIGIIRFNIWMPKLSAAIAAAVDSLRDSDAIILDLRGNVGGLGLMSAGVAGHFADTALTLGTMIQRGGTQKYIINPQRVNGANQRVRPFAGPLAIVVDELSVSTTEIFAAGMQALSRARVFGTQTAGQALPSVAESLPNGDVLYHAIANFLSPTGKPVEGAGVVPDVSAPATRAALLAGRDPALDAAIAWAASSPSRHSPGPRR